MIFLPLSLIRNNFQNNLPLPLVYKPGGLKPPLVYDRTFLNMPNGNIFLTNYVQMLKAIVVVYTIKTGMSDI